MPWSGHGTFSRSNGVNSGAALWRADAVQGADITTEHHDAHDQDIADGINACLTANGENLAAAEFRPDIGNTYSLGSAALAWIWAYVRSGIKFVGSSFTSTLAFAAPTADRTITLPDATGTVLLDAGLVKLGFAAEYDNGNSGASKTVDFANGNFQKITMTGNCTLTLTPPSATYVTGTIWLRLIQDGTGGRTANLAALATWITDLPTLSGTPGVQDWAYLYYNGSAWVGLFFRSDGDRRRNSMASTSGPVIPGVRYVLIGNLVTLTLPDIAVPGDVVGPFLDGTNTTAGFVIARNSHNIMGLAEDLVVDTNGFCFSLIYHSVTNGWRICGNERN